MSRQLFNLRELDSAVRRNLQRVADRLLTLETGTLFGSSSGSRLFVQSGSDTTSSGVLSVTFDEAYDSAPNVALGMILGGADASTGARIETNLTSVSTTGFGVQNVRKDTGDYATADRTFHWVAVGVKND